MRRGVALAALVLTVAGLGGYGPEERTPSSLGLTLRRLQTIAAALHTGAHPDDESTDLLAYLSHGEGARTAYLALTRGEGGQNAIGPELWEGLGVVRTEELLAARRLDGAEQFFTRAFDFGFTLSPDEVLARWNHAQVLGDVVRLIRAVRPLVVINGFSGGSEDGHGQHQVAARLTVEAIEAAADPGRYPEQLGPGGLHPWRVLKVYVRRFGPVSSGPRAVFDVGRYDPLLGRSYAELSAEGRSRHRSQEFGVPRVRGSQPRSFPRLRSAVAVPEVEPSLFTGLDVTIAGIAAFAGAAAARIRPDLVAIRDLVARASSEYRVERPEAIGPTLAEGLRRVRALRATLDGMEPAARAAVDAMLARKEREFTDALARAHGVVVDALAGVEMAAPGESIDVKVNVFIGRPAAPAATSHGGGHQGTSDPDDGNGAGRAHAAGRAELDVPSAWRVETLEADPELPPDAPRVLRLRERADEICRFRVTVPADAPPTQPYWLTTPRTGDQFSCAAAAGCSLPFADEAVRARVSLTLSGEQVVVEQPLEYRLVDSIAGELRRPVRVVPTLALTVQPSSLVIPSHDAGRPRAVTVEVAHHARRPTTGSLRLAVPEGWKVEGVATRLAFSRPGERTLRTFTITPRRGARGAFLVRAYADADGRTYDTGYTVTSHAHIASHALYAPATAAVAVIDARIADGLSVGYVAGSGDYGVEALRQLGARVTMLGAQELRAGNLAAYDTIVLGVRAYEVNESAVANNARLLAYVAEGGTLVVQYHKSDAGLGKLAPYPLTVGAGRVTDENAPVSVLAAAHPLFAFPNAITEEDWRGWTQERGLYFLSEWDPRYTPLLGSSDGGAQPLAGGHVVARYGRGTYVYTGYAWFRQLAAGVPGAYRLFANLVSQSRVT